MSMQDVGSIGRFGRLGGDPLPARRSPARRRDAAAPWAEEKPLRPSRPRAQDADIAQDADMADDEPRPDPAAMLVRALAEDQALVRLAAAKLAGALREVHVLVGRDRAAWKQDALARCTAKGWITVQDDPLTDSQAFRVTPEGYRAAGLRVPLFIV